MLELDSYVTHIKREGGYLSYIRVPYLKKEKRKDVLEFFSKKKLYWRFTLFRFTNWSAYKCI